MKKNDDLSFGIQIGELHMETMNATVSSRGYVVLPARLRKEMNIKAGTKILLSREENKIILQPVSSFTRKLAGLTVQSFGTNPDEVEKFIDGEREER
jgi:AbrB family looped-hinge helix DNA binding protein